MNEPALRGSDGVARYRHEVLAVVLRVRLAEPGLEVLVHRRAREPYQGRWALVGGPLEVDEAMEQALDRHLHEQQPGLAPLPHLEQLETFSDPHRDPVQRTVATAHLGLLPTDRELHLAPGNRWLDVGRLPAMAFDHARLVHAATARLQGKISYTNLAFALAPQEFSLGTLRMVYEAVLGHDVDETNLGRVLRRRGQLERSGHRGVPGERGGRPPSSWRFTTHRYQVTDPFAALGPGRG